MIAGLLVGAAPRGAARADDIRDQFGLGKGAPQRTLPSCDDGLAFNCAVASDPLDAATPYALATWLPGDALRRLPVGDATHEQVAGFALGAHADEAGPIFGGATGLENRWTIDGAPADSLATGAAETRVPLAFLDGLRVTAGGFSARDRASTGGTIDARLRRGTPTHELAADVSASWSRDAREPPIAGYAVRRGVTNVGPSTTASLVATGPIGDLLDGRAWYVAGLAPRLTSTEQRWRAVRLTDADGDGLPDGTPDDLVLTAIERSQIRTLDYDVPILARAGLDRGAHHVDLSLIGNASRSPVFAALATPQAAGIDRRLLVGDLAATWRATWTDTRARLQLAWHRSARRESAHDDAAAGLPQLRTAYIPATLVDDPALAAACADDPQAPLQVPRCPVLTGLFASGGAGRLTDAVGDRPSITADVTQRLGDHVVRAGGTVEHSRLTTTSRFTGGAEQRSDVPGDVVTRRFYAGACSDDPAQPCDVVARSELSYRTIYAAAYLEDTVALRPGLTIDAGLRWELMWVGPRLHFSDELAPRVGVTWDPLGDGRSRLWASYGRSFAMLPAGLGATVIGRDPTVDDAQVGGAAVRTRDVGAPFAIEPGVAPTRQDEITAGAEVALVGALRATVWGQARWLRDGLETTSAGFGNPGGDGEAGATRETELVAAALEMAQRDRTQIRAGVLWGRTVGTWVGPFDPRLGATQLNSPDWDVSSIDASVNLDGPLPSAAGGQAFFEAERRATVGPLGVAVATRLTVGSGRPRNVIASGPDGVIDVLPRGSAGRGPMISQANLRVAAQWHGYTATLEVLNLFDRREVTNLDERYTDGAVRPIAGGTLADLAGLQTVGNVPAAPRAGYQLPTAYQPPLSVTLGVHKAF